jgi:hypothetical protein
MHTDLEGDTTVLEFWRRNEEEWANNLKLLPLMIIKPMNVIISQLQAPVVLKPKPYYEEFLECNKRGDIIQQKC